MKFLSDILVKAGLVVENTFSANAATNTIYAGTGTRLRTEANNLVFERVSSSGTMKMVFAQGTLSPTAKAYIGYSNATLNLILANEYATAGLELRTSDIIRQQIFANGNIVIGQASPVDAGFKVDITGTARVTGIFTGSDIRTGSHAFRDQMYITATTDGWTRQSAYNAASAFTMGFVGDLRFASVAAVKAVFSFNGSYSNNGTIYGGEMSLMKIFTGDAFGQSTPAVPGLNQYGINLMPTLNYTSSTSTFTGFYYNPTLVATTGLTHYAIHLVNGLVRVGDLSGTGTRMVVADSSGVLSTQTIAAGITGSGSTGQLAYWNGSSSQAGTNNLYWDIANNRLGFNTTNPQRTVHIYNSVADNHLAISGPAPSVSLGDSVTGSTHQAKFGLATASGHYAASATAGDFVIISQTGSTIWMTSNVERLKLSYNGNFIVGGVNDTLLAKLQVVGAIQQSSVTSSVLKVDANGVLVAATAGSDFVAPATLASYVPTSRTITINGVSYDLSADRSWTIAGGVTSFNTRTGAISLTSGDVTGALGYTPYNSSNPAGYITSSSLSAYAPNNASFSDANALTTGGFFTAFNASNVPSGLSSLDMGILNIPLWGGNSGGERYTMQLFANLDTNTNFFIRKFKYFGAVNQSDWYTLIHSGNYSSYALPLSGGTLSGNLTMSGAGNSTSIIFGDSTKRINVEGYWMMFKGHENEGFRWQTAGQDGVTYTTRMQLTTSALTVNGNTVLHAGNYNSYALPLSGGTLSGTLSVSSASVGMDWWRDAGGTYMEFYGTTASNRKLRLQGSNGSGSYAQWYIDGGNQQIYGDVAGNRNFLIDSTTAYIRHNGSDKLWGGSDGTRNSGWAYHTNNDTGLHWPNNGWHFYPKDVNDIYMRSGSSTNVAIAMNTGATTRGYVYAENDNTIGFLTNSRSWAFRTYSNGNAQVYGYLTVNGAGTSSSIYMNDSDEGQREIHCNSNRIGFLTQAGSWGAWLYDGADWEAASSVRAPIFYDSANTSYYLDPAGTSVLGGGTDSDVIQMSNSSYGAYLLLGGWTTDTSHARIRVSNGNLHMDAKGGAYDIYLNWYTSRPVYFGGGQYVAGTIYDNSNTGYYLKPSSTSRMNAIVYDNFYFSGDQTYGLFGRNAYVDTINGRGSDPLELNYYDGGSVIIGSGATGSKALYAGSLYDSGNRVLTYAGANLSSVYYFTSDRNTDSSNPPLQAYSGNGSGAIMSFHRGGYYAVNFGLDSDNVMRIGGWSASANRWQLDMSGNNTVAGSFRAPIFYDSNDTTYYLDPNSTGTSLNIAGSVNAANFNRPGLLVNASGTGSAGSAMAIQQVTGEGWTGIFVDYEPYTGWGLYHDNPANYFLITSESANGSFGGGFSVPSRTAGNRTAYVKHRFDQNNGEIIAGGMIYSYASVRAPIFYDSEDTSYYLDPNSTSRLYYVNAPQGYVSNGNPWGTSNSAFFPNGITTAGGTNWIYGFTYIGNAPANGAGHEFNANGSMRSTSSHRATIYYDDSDTSYYLDPNGSSVLSTVYLVGTLRNNGSVSDDDTFGIYWDSSASTAYAIYRESGGWNWPYPDLRIAFHTGIKIGANAGYGGIKFYSDYDMSTIVASINDGDSNMRGYYDIIAYASDRRLKENVKVIDNAIDKVKQLTGMTYNWNSVGAQYGWSPSSEREAGVFAQDVQAVLPEAVRLAPFDSEFGKSKSGENFLTVKYEKIVPLLIEAIKEQQIQIEELKGQLDGITK